jgi:hypothetical protein
MSSSMAKKPRIAISNTQRKALRTWFHDPTVEPRYKNIIGPAHRILIEEVFLYKGN